MHANVWFTINKLFEFELNYFYNRIVMGKEGIYII
jgi:hypothetical protein